MGFRKAHPTLLTWFASALMAVLGSVGDTHPVLAQDSVFLAPTASAPVKEKERRKEVFSFSRFEPSFAAICAELEVDGHRDRFYHIAEAAAAQESKCVSCRAMWRSILSGCLMRGKKLPLAATTVPETDTSKREGVEPMPDQTVAAGTAVGVLDVTPAVTRRPGERHPSTLVIDLVSRLSTEAFEVDGGEGAVSEVFHYLVKVVKETKGLTRVEQEYFDILLAYLLAAWEGRLDESTLPSPTPGQEIEDFFR